MKLTAFLAGLSVAVAASSASAATIGVPVLGPGDLTEVSPTVADDADAVSTVLSNANADITGLGAEVGDVIGFFIPLDSDCTFGVSGCGLSQDSGFGGSLDMFVYFEDVIGGDSTLSLFFEDLDLDGVNDPSNFIETLTVYDVNDGAPVELAEFTSVPASGVSADNSSQTITLGLGDLLPGTDVLLKLLFTSDTGLLAAYQDEYYQKAPRNTSEFLLPVIDGEGPPVNVIPLPAAGWMLIAAMGGLGVMRRRSAT